MRTENRYSEVEPIYVDGLQQMEAFTDGYSSSLLKLCVEKVIYFKIDNMFEIYLKKRLTVPALVVNFSSLSELERIALEKNILVD